MRTQLQHQWADLFEKLADRIGRGIRYGEPPAHWLTEAEREALPATTQRIYNLNYQLRSVNINLAEGVAELIHAYELRELLDPKDPELHDYRARADAALADLTDSFDALYSLENQRTTGL